MPAASPVQLTASSRFVLIAATAALMPMADAQEKVDFVRDIQPIFTAHCVECHDATSRKGGFRLDINRAAFESGDSHAPNLIPGDSANSPLIEFVSGSNPKWVMPPDGPLLSAREIDTLRTWIDQGADWPDSANSTEDPTNDWWALRPLVAPQVPPHNSDDSPIDAFVRAKLAAAGLTASPEADRRTLIRRATFDLHGLPPTIEEVESFVSDPDPSAWQNLIDRLLDSPRYGERWARHWLDVAHYGDTHGYDKDQPRPNAWPYRDYVIRAFNEDRPYARFVKEQIAGDILYPGSRDGLEALGFLAAGPWDLIGHVEVEEEKVDGKFARHLDRDDMVASTIGTFNSLTVHCAQCHDHKFDPITQEEYYQLQAVFAAIDRTEINYDNDPHVATKRISLSRESSHTEDRLEEIIQQAEGRAGDKLTQLDTDRTAAREKLEHQRSGSAASGWHGAISATQDTAQWVQVDLGESRDIENIVLDPCHDTFNNIGDGFGFPLRFKIEASNDEEFTSEVILVCDQTGADFPNPGLTPIAFQLAVTATRYIRVTATKLAPREGDYNFALAELRVFDTHGKLVSLNSPVSSSTSVEAPPRWSRSYLTDSFSPSALAETAREEGRLESLRLAIIEESLTPQELTEKKLLEDKLRIVLEEMATLPEMAKVYVGAVHNGTGAFRGTGAHGGKPRPIYLLARGDVTKPIREVGPGALRALGHHAGRFDLADDAPEGMRRAALAEWLADPHNPLTWRSIVNRIWLYHFGRGIVDTPNDFGRMGDLPSHPELLDWLAVDFLNHGGSIKHLHRRIMLSAAYRQRSDTPAEGAAEFDTENRLLWRMNRRKLDAETVRDSVLAVAGKLDFTMFGPGYRDFLLEHPEHSPHYQYHLADARDPALHRRAIYRFIVRSKPQPWMLAHDCADPSMAVDKRNESVSPLQALARMNNQLILVMAGDFATRLEQETDAKERIRHAFRHALQRDPTPQEHQILAEFANRHGLAAACRVLLNLNEFTFAD